MNIKPISKTTGSGRFVDMWNLAYNLEYGQMTYEIPESTGTGVLTSACIHRNIKMINYNVNFCVPIEMRGISNKPHFDLLFCLGDSVHWELPESSRGLTL